VVAELVIDAAALVDALTGGPVGGAVPGRLAGNRLHAPAHLDAEVLSALGRLHRAGLLTEEEVVGRLRRLEEAPINRHALPPLLAGAWARQHNLRLVDALYVELSGALGRIPLVTTDAHLASAAAGAAELVTP